MNLDYEVETRFYFNCKDDILKIFPKLNNLYFNRICWKTNILKEELFKKDIQFRISEILLNSKAFYYLGYKEVDVGSFCNIRKEIDEQIIDLNKFYRKSIILNKILRNKVNLKSSKESFKFEEKGIVNSFISKMNYDVFLFFEGESEVISLKLKDFIENHFIDKIKEKLDIKNIDNLIDNLKVNLKIMYCNYINYPVIFEVEMISDEFKKALILEKIIKEIVYIYNINNFYLKKEPPSLMLENKYYV